MPALSCLARALSLTSLVEKRVLPPKMDGRHASYDSEKATPS